MPTKRSNQTDPATRSFQALRIFVNSELDELTFGLAAVEELLRPGGLLAVVSFHSLEDRITKQFLASRSQHASYPSRHRPLAEARPAPTFDLVSRKAITPTEAERSKNSRARSAKLRIARRTDAALSASQEYTRELPSCG